MTACRCRLALKGRILAPPPPYTRAEANRLA
nr:MAG TPA: hypothetical protein [Caudoviricetes sp.]